MTNSKTTLIEQHLNNIIEILGDEIDVDSPLTAVDKNFWERNEVVKYADCISREFPEFDDTYQISHFGYSRVDIISLVKWSIFFAKKRDVVSAIDAIKEYIESGSCDVDYIELIDKNNLGSYLFSNGVELKPYTEISNSRLLTYLANQFHDQAALGLSFPKFNSVFSISWKTNATFVTDYSDPKYITFTEEVERKKHDIETIKLCLSLCGDVSKAIFTKLGTLTTSDTTPWLFEGSSYCDIQHKHSPTQGEITNIIFDRADELATLFQRHKPQLQTKLKVALRYLNNYGASESLADRAINLRVCLEAIFTERGEEFNNSTFKNRVSSFATVTKRRAESIYSTCSIAVHDGEIDDIPKTQTRIKEGAEIAKDSIIKIIEEGYPDWKSNL